MSGRPIIPVVMCTWKRINNLQGTIDCLAKQNGVKPHLYIWNNNPSIASEIDRVVSTSSIPIDVIHSDKNVGGFGRFYYAKQLAAQYQYITFIDDDQMLGQQALATLWAEAKPKTITGWWAYNFLSPRSYWLRVRAHRGRNAAYVGTCGMIADSSIFKDERLFDCPKQFWFIEDLWLSYFANHMHHWQLYRSRSHFWFLPDTKNQFVGLVSDKTHFLRYLKKQGWKIGPSLSKTTRS